MHQIRFQPGLHPRPCWGISQHSPKPSSWILGVLLPKGERGQEKEQKKRGWWE